MTPKRRSPVVVLLLLVLGAAVLAGCGDDEDDAASEGDAATTVADGGDDGGGAAPEPAATITMRDYSYAVSGKVTPGSTIRLENTGEEFHMLGLAKLKAGKTLDEAIAAIQSDDRGDDESVYDEVGMPGSFMGPGNEADITVPGLAEGKYVMACFLPVEGEETPHFAKGMTGQFEVSGDAAEEPEADATYTANKGEAVAGPATLKAGHHVLKITAGTGGEDLEPGLVKLNDGATIEQFAAATKVFDGGAFPKGAAAKLPGQIVVSLFDFGEEDAVYLGVDLEKGTYVLTSDDTDVENKPDVPVERITITVT